MKNRILLLSALTAVGFASCTNPNTSGTYTQEQLDSIVQYRVDSIAMELKMQNDSLIYAMADSIAMASKGTKTVTTVNRSTSNQAPAKTTESQKEDVNQPKQGGLRGSSDQAKQNQGTSGMRANSDQAKQKNGSSGGLRSHSDQAKEKQQ